MDQSNSPEILSMMHNRSGIITLRGVHSKDIKFRVQPAYNTKTSQYAGVEPLSEEDKRKRAYFVDPLKTVIVLKDGITFDMSNEVDYINWMWVSKLKQVASSFDEAQSSVVAQFYVEIEGREAAVHNVSFERKNEAVNLIMRDTDTGREEKAMLLGYDMMGSHPETVKEMLYSLANTQYQGAERIINVYNSSTAAIKITILKGMRMGLIVEKNGILQFGSSIIGIDVDKAVSYFIAQDTKPLYDQLLRSVYPEMFVEAPAAAVKPVATQAEALVVEDAIADVAVDELEEPNPSKDAAPKKNNLPNNRK